MTPVPGHGATAAENARRVAAWSRSGDSNRLWPDVRPEDRLAAHARVLDATRAILNATRNPPHLAAPNTTAVRATGIAAFESGMGPLLGWWVERGQLTSPSDLTDLLANHLVHARARSEKLEAVLVRILDTAAHRAITPVLLKGVHTGRAFFPEPATRIGADVDILVAPHERAAMRSVLTDMGLVEVATNAAPFRADWAPPDASRAVRSLELTHADDPWTVDLHITLDRRFAPGVNLTLPEPATTLLDVQGRAARVLAHPSLATFLAVHASYNPHEIQLVRLVELALVLRSEDRYDWTGLAQYLHDTDAARFAYPAFALVKHLFPHTVDDAFLHAIEPAATAATRRMTRALAVSGTLRLPRRSIVEKFMWVRGPREWLGALREAVWPDDDANTVGPLKILMRRLRLLLSHRGGWAPDDAPR